MKNKRTDEGWRKNVIEWGSDHNGDGHRKVEYRRDLIEENPTLGSMQA